MAGVQVTEEALATIGNQISELDVKLDAASGSNASTERVAVNSLLDENRENYSDFVDSIVANLNDAEPASRVATVVALEKVLSNKFGKEVSDFLKERTEQLETEQAETDFTDEEIAEIEAQRKSLVEQFKAIRQLLDMFEVDTSHIDDPKIRRGARGKRGPRTLNQFQYTVNETVLPEESNTLGMVAKIVGVSVKELKEYISNQGVDLKKPTDVWTAKLPNDMGTLTAERFEQFVGQDDDGSDDASEEETE